MANKNAIPPKRSVTATKLLNDAFIRRYGTEENPTTKIGSWKAYKRQLQQFLDYIKGNANVYDSVSTLSKKGIFNYKEWLEDNARKQGKGDSKTIAQKCNTIILLINDIAENPNFDKYKIEHLQPYKFAKSLVKNDEKKVRALTNEEVRVVMECELNDRLNMYREVFTMQLETGVRFSDLNKLFLHEYITNEKDGQKTLTIKTQKETITAVIIVNDTIESLIEKYNSGLPIKLDEQVYNEALKEIFEIAKLTNTEIYYKDFLGTKKEESGRLCDLVSNHWARHTFITNKVREGWNIDTLTYCTGHANDQQIKQVYAHITQQDKINKALKENARVQGNNSIEIAKEGYNEFAYNKGVEDEKQRLINESKDVLMFLGAKYEDIADINSYDELAVLIYVDYAQKFERYGIFTHNLKGIYNDKNKTMKEKKQYLEMLIEDAEKKMEKDAIILIKGIRLLYYLGGYNNTYKYSFYGVNRQLYNLKNNLYDIGINTDRLCWAISESNRNEDTNKEILRQLINEFAAIDEEKERYINKVMPKGKQLFSVLGNK